MVGHFKAAGAALIASFGIAKLKGIADGFDDLAKTARTVDLGIGEWYELRTVFERLGVAGNGVKKAILTIQKQLGDAQNGLSTAVRAFEDLGLNFEDVIKLSPAEALKAVIAGIRDAGKSAKATSAQILFLGRAGKDLGSVLALTTEEYNAYEKAVRDKLIKPNSDAAGNFETMNDNMSLLGGNISTLIGNILGAKNGGFNEIIDDWTKYLKANQKQITKNVEEFGKFISELFDIVKAAGKVLLAIGKLIAKLPILEDLITTTRVAAAALFFVLRKHPILLLVSAVGLLYDNFSQLLLLWDVLRDAFKAMFSYFILQLKKFTLGLYKFLDAAPFSDFTKEIKDATAEQIKAHKKNKTAVEALADSYDALADSFKTPPPEKTKKKEGATDKGATDKGATDDDGTAAAAALTNRENLIRISRLTANDLKLEDNRKFLETLNAQELTLFNEKIRGEGLGIIAKQKIDEKRNKFIKDNAEVARGYLVANSRKAFAIQKAYDITTAISNTYAAATQAFRNFGGFPGGIAPAAASIAAGLANVAQIKARQFNPPRRFGGKVEANLPGLVGENGAELFVPETDGTIVPNPEDGGEFGGTTYQDITIQVGPGARPADVADSISNQFKELLNNGSNDSGGAPLFPEGSFA